MNEAKLQRVWYGGEAPGPGLRALSALYGGAAALRRAAYRRGWLRSERVVAPVIVVGNLVTGGAGKTPLVIAIARWLQAQGRRPGVVSRGYGRRSAGALRVRADTPAEQGGDEPVLIARATSVPVQVDADRVAAAQALVAEGCDVIVADDGLQHYRLARDIEIEVVDGLRRYGNARLLPAGPLREPRERAQSCDLRVVNVGDGQGGDAGQGEWPMRLALRQARALAGDGNRALSEFAGNRVHAVAGIGHPQRFFEALRAAGIEVVPHPFPDHHAFRADELRFEDGLLVLMTEKDAVKCAGFAPPHSYAVSAEAELPEGFWAALGERLAAHDGQRHGSGSR